MHFKELFKKKSTGLLVSFLRQSNFKMFATEIFPSFISPIFEPD